MKFKSLLVLSLGLVAVIPASANNKDKKKDPDRAMLEKMDAVPCGAKQKGVTGVGSIWASVGITHMNSDEKLCPRYLLRTDEMEYEIQPTEKKHPAILPVGKEVIIKIKNDHMTVKNPDGDKKERNYEVIAMKPTDHDSDTPSAKSDDRDHR
ncbi:MAG TPA: hypothetical protein VGI16_02170 [Candidatus Acidoferrum sp.]|jgi:hypothetical protein